MRPASPAALAALLLSTQVAALPLDLSKIGDFFSSLPEKAGELFGENPTTLVFDSAVYRMPDNPEKWITSLRSYTYISSPATDVLFDTFQAFLKPFGVDVSPDAASEILQSRLPLFTSLGISDETLRYTFGDCNGSDELGPSPLTGMVDQPAVLAECNDVKKTAIHFSGDDEVVKENLATAFMSPPTGWGVISDIDDTIKVSHVLDKIRTVSKTFLEPLEPAPGMADLYSDVSEKLDTSTFLYLSGSPFQLYPMLKTYLADEGFPAGPIMLQNMSIADPAALVKLVTDDPMQYKLDSIDRFNSWYPGKTFLAVGDSGQRDSEVYGEAYRKFGGEWMGCIWIRQIEDEGANNTDTRFAEAFRDVPENKWRVFKDPAEMKEVDLAAGEC